MINLSLFCIQLSHMSSESQSNLHSEDSSPQPHPQRHISHSSSDSPSSSEEEDDSQIVVQYTSRMNDIKKQSSSLRHFQQQIQELKRHNNELRTENKHLTELISRSKEDQTLKKLLKQKEREILELRRQITSSNYYDSSKNISQQPSAINVNIEDRKYKLRSKSIKNKSKHKQSVDSSIEDEQSSVRLHAFDHVSELRKIKTQKIILEKQFYELQEKILIYEQELRWSRNLATKLVSFAEKLSFIFKDKVFQERWQLLKRAKASWRYLKHILKYVLQIK